MSLRTEHDLADLMKVTLPSLQWISGKWFLKGRQVKESVLKKLLVNTSEIRSKITTKITIKSGLQAFIDDYGDPEGDWPILPLAKKALEQGPLYDIPDGFEFLNDPRKLLIINRLVFHPTTNNRMIIICGGGGTGKSTFLNVIAQCFEWDCSYSDLSSLLSDNTILANALQCRLILSDELNGDDISNAVIKQVINQQKVVVRKVYQDAREIRSQSQLIFATNKPPRFDITDGGMMRRILFYKMDKKPDKPIEGLDKKVYTDDQITDLLRFALYFDTDEVKGNGMMGRPWWWFYQKDTREFILKNCNVAIYRKNEIMESYKDDYDTYSNWARSHGYKPFNYSNFLEVTDILKEWEEEEKSDVSV